MTGFDRLRRSAAPHASVLCALSLLGATSAAAADDASRWDGDARSAVRLIAGSPPADKTASLRAGVEIRIKPGWHTYWRYPGDAGVPPRFDFAGSQNVKSVDVLWPAPQRIPEHDLVAIGYSGDVILPLAVVPQDRAKPVTLRLKLDYAVCEKLCVPAEGKAQLALTGAAASFETALAAARSAGPQEGRARRRLGARHQIRSARERFRPTARHRRCRRTARSRRCPVRRGTDAGMGPAGADRGRWSAGGPASFLLRTRWRAHRRHVRGRVGYADRSRGQQRNRGRGPSRLIRRAR